ncbi:hypothetical protein K525DRAFT_259090 [Schizophyllum commune Loenen D]|nr:hypothetical protein K525DRAFT_259090 [Schizophyllum commune Loenen D]
MDPSTSNITRAEDVPTQSQPSQKPDGFSIGRRYPATTHFAVAAAILLPVACIPYFVYRRRIRSLELQLQRLNDTLLTLQDDATGYIRQQASASSRAHARSTAAIQNLSKDVSSLRIQMNEDICANMERSDNTAKDMDQVLAALRLHASLLRSLGVSLADVANFMHDQELRLGLNTSQSPLEVDKLRHIAVRLRELKDVASVPKTTDKPAP